MTTTYAAARHDCGAIALDRPDVGVAGLKNTYRDK